jgi:hypothetical protein
MQGKMKEVAEIKENSKINVRELRLGNLFRDKVSGELLIVTLLDDSPSDLGGKVVFEVCDVEKYPLPEGWEAEPIPLSAEWLLENQFKFCENKGDTYEDEDGEIQSWEDNPYYYLQWDDQNGRPVRFCVYLDRKSCYVGVPCEFVHQLQNALFITKGMELEEIKKLQNER